MVSNWCSVAIPTTNTDIINSSPRKASISSWTTHSSCNFLHHMIVKQQQLQSTVQINHRINCVHTDSLSSTTLSIPLFPVSKWEWFFQWMKHLMWNICGPCRIYPELRCPQLPTVETYYTSGYGYVQKHHFPIHNTTSLLLLTVQKYLLRFLLQR